MCGGGLIELSSTAIEDRTYDGRRYRMLNVIDEFTHECLAIWVARKLKAIDVIDVLSDLFILRGVPCHVRSDNGPEFVAEAVQGWITAVGAKTAYIERGSPWENGYIESFNARQAHVLAHVGSAVVSVVRPVYVQVAAPLFPNCFYPIPVRQPS